MEEELQESSELMELSEIKGIVRRHRWHFLVPFFLGWLLVWGISWVLPSTYRSGTLILVEQPAVPQQFVVSNINTDIQQQLDSITQQILSRTRLLHIIETLNLYSEGKHKNPDELVEVMRKDIDIELVRGDDRKLSAFNIYYTNRNPEMAQRATNELARLFITENSEQRQERSENTTKFLEDQLAQARAKLAEQEARVREFKDKHTGELPSQTQSNLQILGGLQAQLQAQEDSLNRAKQQNTYLESLLNQYRTLEHGGSGGTGTIGLSAIDQELDRLKAQLADLSSHYTDKHPDVRKTKEQIARTEKMRERIVSDINNKASSSSTSEASGSTPLGPESGPMLDLESQLKANRIEIVNHQGSIRELQNKVYEYQGRLNRAPVMEQQFSDITRDYEQSKANYDSLLAKRNQSEMATNLERTQQGEHFRMLDPPNLPVKPFKPKRLQICGIGLIAGLLFGGAAAFGREKLSGKVYTEREFKKLVPFDVIAEIPPIETPAEQVSHRRSNWAAGGAAVAIMGAILLGTAITYLFG